MTRPCAVEYDEAEEAAADEDGDWRKHNGIKADRAGGFRLVNMAFELFRENAIYVHETDGYLLDRVEANFNDLYGILTFTADHGVIANCDTHHNALGFSGTAGNSVWFHDNKVHHNGAGHVTDSFVPTTRACPGPRVARGQPHLRQQRELLPQRPG